MARGRTGHQRTWKRDSGRSFLWPWRDRAFYPGVDDPTKRLDQLRRIWQESGTGHFAALLDALLIVRDAAVQSPAWVSAAALDAVVRHEHAAWWWRRYRERDFPDVARAMEFEFARDPEDGLGLSRAEAAIFATESLAGTIAETSPRAVEKLVGRMKVEDARQFGRYYLCAGTIRWQGKHLPRLRRDTEFILKWRHRAALRKNERMEAAERFALEEAREEAAQGSKRAREYLDLFSRLVK
jgi:hypothetical protein